MHGVSQSYRRQHPRQLKGVSMVDKGEVVVCGHATHIHVLVMCWGAMHDKYLRSKKQIAHHSFLY